jgi:hypothetical protein
MAAQPARPDVPQPSPRIGVPSLVWIAAGGVVGLLAIVVVLNMQDRGGNVPPTSTFAAAAIAISVVAIVTVALAAHAAGTSWRAAIALGGGFAAIAIAKFGMGPTALYQGNRVHPIDNIGGLTSGDMVVLIAVIVGVLYAAAIWLLATVFRPAPPPDGPSGKVVIGLGVFAIGALVAGSVIISSAPGLYLDLALTGVEAGGIALALFVAAALVAAAFHDASVRSRALGQTSMYLTVLWVAIAFLVVFQVLWIVFLLAIVAIWPFKSVTPK